jgi:hypothetical protein
MRHPFRRLPGCASVYGVQRLSRHFDVIAPSITAHDCSYCTIVRMLGCEFSRTTRDEAGETALTFSICLREMPSCP